MRVVPLPVLAALLAPAAAAAQPALPQATVFETDTLHDVALTRLEAGRPVIYVNPALMLRFGPRLARFFLLHEYGHVAEHHVDGAALAGHGLDPHARRLRQELEADCWAARALGAGERDVVDAARHFFTRMGPHRYDVQHPTGAQRAAMIAACAGPADGGPAGGTAEGGDAAGDRIRVLAPAFSPSELACDVEVWLDGQRAGTVSTVRQPRELQLTPLATGVHRYRLVARRYTLDRLMQLNLDGTLTVEGEIALDGGGALAVDWPPGGRPRLVRH